VQLPAGEYDVRVPAAAPRVLPAVRCRRASHTSATAHTSRLRSPQVLPTAGDSAARPGSCRKPPGALYVESGEALALSFFVARCGWATLRRPGGVPHAAVPSAQQVLPSAHCCSRGTGEVRHPRQQGRPRWAQLVRAEQASPFVEPRKSRTSRLNCCGASTRLTWPTPGRTTNRDRGIATASGA